MSHSAPGRRTPDIVRSDVPRSTTRWQHEKGSFYTVLLVSNESSERPDDYPLTVVYQDDAGKVWSRPLSRWHGSMTEVPSPTPGELARMPDVALTEETSLVAFEWLSAMWAAVSTLENRNALLAERTAAALGLRARLTNEVAAPMARQPVQAQLRSPEDPEDAPWRELPLADVAKAEANGYEVRYLFDHAEGSPAAAVIQKGDGHLAYHLLASAQNLEDGSYALHALRITDSEAAVLSQAPTTERPAASPIT